jgi:hypothetical protein
LFFVLNLRERKELLLDHSSSGQVQNDLQATDICLGGFFLFFIFLFFILKKHFFEREERITVGP